MFYIMTFRKIILYAQKIRRQLSNFIPKNDIETKIFNASDVKTI